MPPLSGNMTTGAAGLPVRFDLVSLYGTLVSCFATMALGYATVRLRLVGQSELAGLKHLLVYLLTPAMLIDCLLKVTVGDVNWNFVACIFTAKLMAFVLTAGITATLSADAAKAGLYAIFVTQSNDLALGLPLVQSLYGADNAFVPYLYAVIPFVLVFNSVGFGLIEFEKQRRTEGRSAVQGVLAVANGLLTNPMLMAIVVGCVGNVFRAYVPGIGARAVSDWARAFPTVALFVLGTSMAHTPLNRRYHAVTPVMLVLTKIVLVPVFIRALCQFTALGRTPTEHSLFTGFGFLYGCLPAAPSVFVYAYYADVAVHQISNALALCTFLAAPWLLMTANMVTLSDADRTQISATLSLLASDMALAAALFAAATLFSLLFGQKRWCVPRVLVYPFLIAAVLNGLGKSFDAGFLAQWYRAAANSSSHAPLAPPLLSSYAGNAMWVAATALAYSLYLLRCRSLCALVRQTRIIYAVVFCVPLAIALTEKLVDRSIPWLEPPVLTCQVLLCIVLLIRQQLSAQPLSNLIRPQLSKQPEPFSKASKKKAKTAGSKLMFPKPPKKNGGSANEDVVEMSPVHHQSRREDTADIEDLVLNKSEDMFSEDGDEAECMLATADGDSTGEWGLCAKSTYCGNRVKCRARVGRYIVAAGQYDEQPGKDVERCVILVCSVCTAMVLRLLVLLWRSWIGSRAGVFWQLSIIDVIATNAQGMLAWLIFGVNWEQLMGGLGRRWRAWRHGTPCIVLPPVDQLDTPTVRLAQSFVANHLQRCHSQMKHDAAFRRRKPLAPGVFDGAQFVDWLMCQTLAPDRQQAEKLGRRLVLAGLIYHVKRQEQFHDDTRLYYAFDAKVAEFFAKLAVPARKDEPDENEDDVDNDELRRNEQNAGKRESSSFTKYKTVNDSQGDSSSTSRLISVDDSD